MMIFGFSGNFEIENEHEKIERIKNMKITFNKSELVQAVSNVQRAVSAKNSIPALEGILIKAYDNKAILCGYDLEIGIRTELEATIVEEGEIVLSAKLFSEIVRRMPDEIITIETDEKLITYINSGVADYQIVGISSYEYPELPSFEELESFELNGNLLKNMIKQTYYAISDNQSKPIYTGSLFDLKDGHLQIVSVDGFRMAVRKEKIEGDFNFNFIVPGKTLSEVLKINCDEEGTIRVIVGKKHVIFEIENYSVVSRLIEGKFLEYAGTIPNGAQTSLRVKTREIASSVERMSLLTSEKLQSPVRFIVADEGIKLACTTVVGKASDYINLPFEGSEVEIGFNNRYLLDAIKNADTDELLFEFNGPLKPLKVLPVEGDSFIFLVVPMRLS